MPTYINNTAKTMYVEGTYVHPAETVKTNTYVDMPGLSLTDHSPYMSKTILYYEEKNLAVGEEVTISIPLMTQNSKYNLSVISTLNAFTLYVDMCDDAIGLPIDAMTSYVETLDWHKHAYIKLVNDNADVAKARVAITAY